MPAWSRSMLNMYISLISLVLLLVLRCHSTIIQTNGSTLHFWKGTADCPNGEPCSIYCDTGKGGSGICEGAKFNCPTYAQLHVVIPRIITLHIQAMSQNQFQM
eukprot:481113_1